ncbi:hypothetical protein COO60DRAFT_1504119 [Scenedesmus sp. NREL 46B-D3]|nr:hypothetical protein COO60DRAFT_1504119 [Scenedesmus sp. NREL 46B-D3]
MQSITHVRKLAMLVTLPLYVHCSNRLPTSCTHVHTPVSILHHAQDSAAHAYYSIRQHCTAAATAEGSAATCRTACADDVGTEIRQPDTKGRTEQPDMATFAITMPTFCLHAALCLLL